MKATYPTPSTTDQRAAWSVVKGLENGGKYLLKAAHRLKDRGDAYGASQAHQRSVLVSGWYQEMGGDLAGEADPSE